MAFSFNLPNAGTPAPTGIDLKNSLSRMAQKPGGGKAPDLGGAPMTPSQAPFERLDTGARQNLLTAMLQRARGGTPGGAPNAPLPVPNSQVPPTASY